MIRRDQRLTPLRVIVEKHDSPRDVIRAACSRYSARHRATSPQTKDTPSARLPDSP
jgi:hypothetical protein